ncbi:MAG: hypothetical protein AB7P03_25350 [Kofleriaceae bacterium]
MRWLAFAIVAGSATAGCAGETGTISLELVTAPGSQLIDSVARIRLTVTDPHAVLEAMRGPDGFNLAIDVDATGDSGSLIVEGFDANNTLIASGMSPPFPVAAIDARIRIYVAPPMSIARSPSSTALAVSDLAVAALPFRAMFAGGRDVNGAPVAAVGVYNAFDHTITAGVDTPFARGGIALAPNVVNTVYMFGGTAADGSDTGTLVRYDTTAEPNGAVTTIGDQPALARSHQLALRIGADRFLITGGPPLVLEAGVLTPRADLAALPPAGAAVLTTTGEYAAVLAGADGVIWFHDDQFTITPGDRDRAGVTALPDGKIAIAGGGTVDTARDLVIVDPLTGASTVTSSALATARFSPAVAATQRHLVIAGGVDQLGAPIATAEVFDAATLARLAELAVEPRAGAVAVALPTDQVLIAGGASVTDAIELFTPGPPP